LGKTKNKNSSSEEYYKGEIRKLKKEVRQLRKQVQQNTHEPREQDTEISGDSEDTIVEVKKLQDCLSCGKGKMIEFDIVGRTYGTCNICGERKKLK